MDAKALHMRLLFSSGVDARRTTAQDAGESASSPLPTSMPCKEEERVNCRAAVRQMQRQMQWVFQAGSVFLTASLLGAGQQHAANGHLHAAASSVVGQMWQRGLSWAIKAIREKVIAMLKYIALFATPWLACESI